MVGTQIEESRGAVCAICQARIALRNTRALLSVSGTNGRCWRKAGGTVIREHGAGPKALILLQQRVGLWRATCATKLRDWLKTGRSGENFQETPAHSDSYSYSKFLLKKHIHLNMYGPTWALFCWIGCLYFLIHASPSSLSLYESHCCSCRFIVILYSILCIVILYTHTTWTSKTILKCGSVHFY